MKIVKPFVSSHSVARATSGTPEATAQHGRALWLSGPVRLVVVVLAGVVAFGVWATHSNIDEIARARGQVIAVARTQIVQAAQEGVLAELMVEQGQTVNKGQLLARLDQTRAKAAFDDSSSKVAALKASLARLRAEVYRRPLVFPKELDRYRVFRENQMQLYRVRRQALEEGIAAFAASRDQVLAELRITEPLLAGGDVGQAEVIRLKRQEAELEGQIVNLRNKFFQDAQADMTRAEEELATQEQQMRERGMVLAQTELRAPMDGVVRNISITTPGAALRPGEVVMEILPRGSELVVEAKFLPANVAALRPGLSADIKLDAYDYSIFGSVPGEVIYVSPDALMERDPRNGSEAAYYRVQVRLGEPRKVAGREPVSINPGMTVTAEVRTRDRTVFSFLSKPITKTLSQALTER